MKTISEIQLNLQMQTMALGTYRYYEKIFPIEYRIKLDPVETIEITSQTIEQSVIEKFLSE